MITTAMLLRDLERHQALHAWRHPFRAVTAAQHRLRCDALLHDLQPAGHGLRPFTGLSRFNHHPHVEPDAELRTRLLLRQLDDAMGHASWPFTAPFLARQLLTRKRPMQAERLNKP